MGYQGRGRAPFPYRGMFGSCGTDCGWPQLSAPGQRSDPYEIFKNDWSIIGSFALCYTFQPAIAWLAAGVVDVEPLVSHTLPMNQFAEGFAAFAQGKTLKVQMVNGGG